MEEIIPKPEIFTKKQTQYWFRVCDIISCNLLSETRQFVLSAILSCLVCELLKPSSSGLEHRTFFVFVTLVPLISSSMQINFALAPFFYRA
jgi:hypothetical protein